MRILICSIFFTFLAINSYSQEAKPLYMPREFQEAYKNKTRAFNGEVGENYWQNSSDYVIEAEIVPGTWKIYGKQTISYTNNSPDSLSEIVIKMYPNHYKKGGVRANKIPLENLTNGMVISNLKVNDEVVNLGLDASVSNLAHATKKKNPSNNISVSYNSTFLTLEFNNKPIPPNSTTKLSMDWETEMPLIYVNKIGAYDKESAFIGYWYPQIAVYDDIDGWDKNEYTGAQECYTDFGNFNVKIKVPKGNYVFATGELLNAEAVLSPQEYEAYILSKTSPDSTRILNANTKDEIGNSKSTWHFKAKQVRDFGFGVSNNFNWLANTTLIEDKKVSSNIVYSYKDEKNLRDLLNTQQKSIEYLSNELPGVPYPYQSFTSFIGVPEFDGMEFPMMANNGFSKREISNNLMTFHELAHTYLPHWVGINEVKYSWMEEGWATFLTFKFCQNFYKDTAFENYELQRAIKSYNRSAGKQWETPLFSPSNYMVVRNMHFQQSYRKPAFMYLALEYLLGEERFKRCFKTYLNRWKEKHPTPFDFMFTFNDVSGENLNWFWKKWVFEYGYADLGLKKIEGSKVVLENVGDLPVPVSLKLTYANNKTAIINKTPEIWSSGKSSVFIEIANVEGLISVELISDSFPDVNTTNNLIEIKK
ncbi:M1 family metallopeptidase [Algibacter pacificus]|uniref:M1 family metallopeptidase n=1 Tax=Algibacter pacificus TaxID=2599389 RepID=UPI0011CC1ABA|nr:M1 family metallopeptidase [Algibacter pacificus]